MKTIAKFALVAMFVTAAAHAAVPRASDWRDVDPNNLVLIDTRYGEVAVELAPDFAPNHVARVRALVRAHFYDGKSFYRVIDGFVAQGGIGEGTAATKAKEKSDGTGQTWPLLKAEFDAPVSRSTVFTPLGSPDLFAPQVGYVGGFPAGRDGARMWIVHCPGTFAFARDNGNDTASTEFYIVIGEAPRRLDRNLTAFGRVIDGLQYVQKLERGDPAVDSGVIADVKRRDPILRARIAADIPAGQRPHYQVMRTESAAFAAKKAEKLNPAPAFYHRKPPAILDICILPAPARRVGG
jgi:peptidylprolyl isomerase